MRTGGYTLQQSLTPEAATIAKQAVSLARRRGHAQVTPLHVATIMFASSNGLFKRACLQSHSHPLQTKALELCFNVALNRLPTSTSSPILISPHLHSSYPPSLSNALIAAFKRAQAHQRRGSSENQQPILALKIDIEQLVVSILDDPSVSRVMREAGFSSTQVKNKVEEAASVASVGIRSHTSDFLDHKGRSYGGNLVSSQNMTLPTCDIRALSFSKVSDYHARDDDVASIISALIDKKTRNIVIVGECLVTAENVVRGVIDKFDSGNVDIKMQSLKFISVPLYSLSHISKQEFEIKIEELRTLVRSFASRGVVLYLGDLKWVCEYWGKYSDRSAAAVEGGARGECYSAVEEMVMELRRLSSGVGGCGKVWIMGCASFGTYMKCKVGNPSLESLWELQAFTIPVGSLALGLSLESDHLNNHGRGKVTAEGSSSWFHGKGRAEEERSTHDHCTNYTNNSNLPMWLQKYKEDKIDHQEEEKAMEFCSKLNSIRKSVHNHTNHFLEKDTLQISSASPSSSTSVSSNDSKLHLHNLKEQNFFLSSEKEFQAPKLDHKPVLLSNPNSSPNSVSSSEASGEFVGLLTEEDLFKEQSQENFEILYNALEKVVPWQRDAIHEIVNTILKRRNGEKSATWMFFSGEDSEDKEKIARELAKVVFGSQDKIFNICESLLSTDGEEVSNKRKRTEHGMNYFERFAYEVKENPSRVFFIQDVEHLDYISQMGFKNAMDCGSFNLENGDSVFLKDAIVIFSGDGFSSGRLRASSVTASGDRDDEQIKKVRCTLDLNVATYDHEDVGFLTCVDKIVMFKV